MRRLLHSSFWQIGWLVLLLAPVGCATKYHEPAKSEKRTAELVAIAPVWLVSIDGRKVSHFGFSGEQHLRVPAGRHYVLVRYSATENLIVKDRYGRPRNVMLRTHSQSDVLLVLLAEPDHTYYVKSGDMGNVWKPRISESRDPVFLDLPVK